MDEGKKSIQAALLCVQSALKAPKSQRNDFGKYNYRSCEDILESVKPLLKENGLTLTLSDDLVLIGQRYYIKATATVSDDSGDSLSCTAYAREPEDKKGMDASQITGASSSYARKYALNGLFCIDDTKDADTNEYTRQGTAGGSKSKQKPAEESNPIICSCCGKPIVDVQWNGRTIKAQYTASDTQKKFGRIMCFDCASKQNKA